jgi:AcrR family transcriptional regulator
MTETAAPGRRERKRLQTRRQLVAAAIELFEERGFDAVTVTEIAERADVDPSTFFRHFGSKDAVLFTDMEEFIANAEHRLAADPLEVGVPVLALLLETTKRATVTDPFDPTLELLRAKLQISSPEIHAQSLVHREELVKAIATGVARQLGVDPDDDPVPYLVATVWIAGFDWLRRRAVSTDTLMADAGAAVDAVAAAIERTSEELSAGTKPRPRRPKPQK